MKVAIVCATEKEILPIREALNTKCFDENIKTEVSLNNSGIGILASCFSISKLIFEQQPDLVIQAGIAGTFNEEETLGKVLVVKEEIHGDLGVEENGLYKDLFDLGLENKNIFPFFNKKLINTGLSHLNYLELDEVTGITISEITTRLHRINQLKNKYNAAIESMEGASLHYSCLQTSTSFIQIRAISNHVGVRDKSKWAINSALKNLTNVILLYIEQLNKVYY